ncbi:MAG: hypothetical protein IPG81_10845 [Sandaracinaceae bacterium]|nr:hypothetical protein [Sandaracinaceae bacterium]
MFIALHLLSVLGLLLAGCADDVAQGPCDTRFRACQERIAREVLAARGGPVADLPVIEVITEAELRERFSEEMMALTPEEELSFAWWGRALVLLRLVESPAALTAGTLEDFVTHVAGYYDRETRVITLIDRGVPRSLEDASNLFAHEFAHHVQNVDESAGFALHDGLDDTLDGVDALSHHGEGEAVVISGLVTVALRGDTPEAQDWEQYFAGWLVGARAEVADSADPYVVVRSRMKYPVGGAYLMDAWLAGGADGLREQWTPGVRETASWMHGYGERASAEPIDHCEIPRAPLGYAAWTDERLGGELLFPMLVPPEERGEVYLAASWASAMGWRGDHLRVFVGPTEDAPIALAYRVRTASLDAARDIAARLTAAQDEQVIVMHLDTDVLLLASEEPGAWDALSFPLDCAGVPMGLSPARMRSLADRLPPLTAW